MKKLLVSSAIITLVATVFTGCIGSGNVEAPGESPEDVVKQAFANLYDTTSHTFEVTMDFELMADDQAINGSLDLVGGQDMTTPEKPKFELALEFMGSSADYEDQAGKAEVKMDGENLYFVLHSITDFGGELPMEFVEGYLGQWFNMAIPPEAAKQLAIAGSEETLTEEEKAFREFLKNELFFKNLELATPKDGNLHYTGELDKEALVEIMVEASKMNGDEISAGDIRELETGMETIDFTADIYIDPTDMIVVGMEGDIFMEGEGDTGTITFEATISDFNEPLDVEAPADSTLFDPMALLGGAMMMAQPDMGMYGDDFGSDFAEFDYDSDYDFDSEFDIQIDDFNFDEDYIAR